MPEQVSMKQLLEAGVHFGHQSRRWNPKMAKYIFTERNGIYIVDLKKTLRLMREALRFVRESVVLGKKVLFVGTKKQARDSISASATGCGMYYVNNRWLGGMLTNFKTIRRSIMRLIELENMWEDGTIERYSKKEISRLEHEKNGLAKNLTGVKRMTDLPGLLFIVDPHKENIAVHEARKLRIPIVAIVDTNCDPDLIDYVIPGNDDAIRAIKLMAEQVKLACIEGLMELQAIEGVAPEGLSPEVAGALGLPVSRPLPEAVAQPAAEAPPSAEVQPIAAAQPAIEPAQPQPAPAAPEELPTVPQPPQPTVSVSEEPPAQVEALQPAPEIPEEAPAQEAPSAQKPTEEPAVQPVSTEPAPEAPIPVAGTTPAPVSESVSVSSLEVAPAAQSGANGGEPESSQQTQAIDVPTVAVTPEPGDSSTISETSN